MYFVAFENSDHTTDFDLMFLEFQGHKTRHHSRVKRCKTVLWMSWGKGSRPRMTRRALFIVWRRLMMIVNTKNNIRHDLIRHFEIY